MTATMTRPARTNRYAGACATCGNQVPAETGSLERVNGAWKVRHIDGCPAPTPAPAPKAKATDASSLPAGITHYALGDKADPRRYQVNRPTRGRWVGWTFVDFIDSATGNRIAVRDRTQSNAVLAEILADPIAAGTLYADVTGRCWKCHTELFDEPSVITGIGPDCFEYVHGHRRTVADVAAALEAEPDRIRLVRKFRARAGADDTSALETETTQHQP
jgi:hypothetical protein